VARLIFAMRTAAKLLNSKMAFRNFMNYLIIADKTAAHSACTKALLTKAMRPQSPAVSAHRSCHG
jgi:hypothetical protein